MISSYAAGKYNKSTGTKATKSKAPIPEFKDRDQLKLNEPRDHTPRSNRNTAEKDNFLKSLGLAEPNPNPLNLITMYDPPKDEKSWIYNGISRDHEGRYKYLAERRKHHPDQKYMYPMTTSMEYGWSLYDDHSKFSYNKTSEKIQDTADFLYSTPPKYALRSEALNSFYRHNGVMNFDQNSMVESQRWNQ